MSCGHAQVDRSEVISVLRFSLVDYDFSYVSRPINFSVTFYASPRQNCRNESWKKIFRIDLGHYLHISPSCQRSARMTKFRPIVPNKKHHYPLSRTPQSARLYNSLKTICLGWHLSHINTRNILKTLLNCRSAMGYISFFIITLGNHLSKFPSSSSSSVVVVVVVVISSLMCLYSCNISCTVYFHLSLTYYT